MTAEIAILNKEAVALAADSAVAAHIGNGNKIFTSANKSFEYTNLKLSTEEFWLSILCEKNTIKQIETQCQGLFR